MLKHQLFACKYEKICFQIRNAAGAAAAVHKRQTYSTVLRKRMSKCKYVHILKVYRRLIFCSRAFAIVCAAGVVGNLWWYFPSPTPLYNSYRHGLVCGFVWMYGNVLFTYTKLEITYFSERLPPYSCAECSAEAVAAGWLVKASLIKTMLSFLEVSFFLHGVGSVVNLIRT